MTGKMSLTINSKDKSKTMASVETQLVTDVPKPFFKPIIDNVSKKSTSSPAKFDVVKHLAFTPPERTLTMKDIGYQDDIGISPVAVSEPFQLFSSEAVEEMRSEIFKPEVLKRCSYQSDLAACQLRGYAPKYAPFTYDAWTHPETLRIVSSIAGLDLIPVMDFEIGHINISVKTEEQTKAELETITKQKRLYAEDEGIAGCPWEDDKPVVGWHEDSYPFVCVLMLSDCTKMVGGETALRKGDGSVIKIRGPQMGCAVILQGRYITHQALRALGAQERITSVTSFRPKSSLVADETILKTIRPVSNLSELYYEFGEYRLEILEERIRVKLKRLRDRRRAGKKCDVGDLKKFLEGSQAFLNDTNVEIIDKGEVVAGVIDDAFMSDHVYKAMTASSRTAKRGRLA